MKMVPQLGVRVEIDGIEGVVGAWLEAIPAREVLTPLVQCFLLLEHDIGEHLYPILLPHLEMIAGRNLHTASTLPVQCSDQYRVLNWMSTEKYPIAASELQYIHIAIFTKVRWMIQQ